MTKPVLVIVDDEPEIASLIGDVAEDLGFDTLLAFSARECLEAVREKTATGIVMDVVMPDMDGIELIQNLAKIGCSAPIIVMTGYQELYLTLIDTIAEDSGLVIASHLHKPFTPDILESQLEDLLGTKK